MRQGWLVLAMLACCTPRVHVEPPAAEPTRPPSWLFAASAHDRLPRTFVPRAYQLALSLGDTRFTGRVAIDGDVTEAAPAIWLHAVGLDLLSARAIGASTVALDVVPVPIQRMVALVPAAPLPPGRWTIEVVYLGWIADNGQTPIDEAYATRPDAVGLFEQRLGSDRYVFTQLEPMYARGVVPCVDEPDRKVPWQLTLEVPRHDVALSNTPVVRETLLGERKQVEFARTQPLPSYLLAFAVGPFDVVDAGRSASGVPIRIFTQRGRTADAVKPVRWTAALFDRVEDHLGVPYAYGKLDLVAVPWTGTHWGAMENPGLITFNQSLMRHGWIPVIAHELAHQWFGDLVTNAWWDDIWLNEGFAEWLAQKIVRELGAAAIEPLGPPPRDAGPVRSEMPRRVRPTLAETYSFQDLAPYFAGVLGAQVIERFEEYVGEDRFATALREYLTTHAHGSVTTADLAAALAAAGFPVDAALAFALDQQLKPVVDAKLVCTPTPRLEIAILGDQPWVGPVCVGYEQAGARVDTCVMASSPTTITLPACPKWVLLAGNTRGFFTANAEMMSPAALFDLAGRWLTPKELAIVLAGVTGDDDAAAVRIASRMLGSRDPDAVERAAAYFLALARFLPPKVLAWIAQTIHPSIDDVAHPKTVQLAALVDASLREEAVRRATGTPAPGEEYLYDIAIRASGDVARRLLHTLRTWPSTAVADAITASPELAHFLVDERDTVSKLPDHIQGTLLDGGCDDAHLAAIAGYRDAKIAALRVKQCIDRRAKLAPVWKAWTPPARDTSSP